MPTKVYGASDNAVICEGDFAGKVEYGAAHEREHGVLVALSDGTLLELACTESGGAFQWHVQLLHQGVLFQRIEDDDRHRPHSQVATFGDGITWAYVSTKWEAVR